MKHPSYPVRADSNLTSFTFESKGASTSITKLVEFSLIQGRIYNLAFGDVAEDGELDDSVISDNKDMELVLATVISIVVVFFKTYPDSIVFFTGSSRSRTRLYQIIRRILRQTPSDLVFRSRPIILEAPPQSSKMTGYTIV